MREGRRPLLQSLLRLLPSPKSVAGFLGYLLVALYPLSVVLSALGNADLIAKNINQVEYVLSKWWGYPLLMLLGFLLLLYAGYRQQARQSTQSVSVVQQAGTSEAEKTREVEQLQKRLRRTEQERDRYHAMLADPTAKRQHDEEMLRRRCFDLAQEVRSFAAAHKWPSFLREREAVKRFRRRHYEKVTELRDELDKREWLTAEEREALTLFEPDGMDKIGQMAKVLDSIASGHSLNKKNA